MKIKIFNVLKKEVELTELETKVYLHLKEQDEFEDCYCNDFEDISSSTEISVNKLRGVLSSLIKKYVVYEDELVSGCGEWIILYEDKLN